jgi:hypothetical protein
MTLKNRKVHRIEAAVPGVPRIMHLEVHAACDRFLASRGLSTQGAFRKSAWLYGGVTTERKSS